VNKKQKTDKLLLENIDRIVAGEKLQDESGLDKDTRAALELTREMTSWPKSPSREFKTELKARVTHQLAEEEKREAAKNGRSELSELIHRPAWRFTIAALIVTIIAAIIYLITYLLNR
jgi:hypothetical protein